MRRFLLALLLCAACKHSTSSSSTSHTETSTVTDSTSSESGSQTTVTTTSEAPGKTTTTVEEFGPPEAETGDRIRTDVPGITSQASVPPGVRPAAAAPVDQDRTRAGSLPVHGPLVKRTVTVTERGAETTETHQQASTQAQGATETKAQGKVDATAKAQSETKPAVGCAVAGWMWGVLIVAGIVGIILGALKVRKAV